MVAPASSLTSLSGRVREVLAWHAAARAGPRRASQRRHRLVVRTQLSDEEYWRQQPAYGGAGVRAEGDVDALRRDFEQRASTSGMGTPQLPPLQEVLGGPPASYPGGPGSRPGSPAPHEEEDEDLEEEFTGDPTKSYAAKPVQGVLWKRFRAAAARMNAELDVSALTKGKEDWLYFTLPEKPVAGEPAVVFYNRARSGALKERPRVCMQAGYNSWELDVKSWDLLPAACPRGEGVDWWSATVQVPEEAFELKFVFSDGEQTYDNNNGQDFFTPVLGPVTPQGWSQILKDREAAAEEARKAEEARRLSEQLASEQRAKEQGDVNRAQGLVDALKRDREYLQSGATAEFRVGGPDSELVQWRVIAPAITAGSTISLRYNTAVGPFSGMRPEAGTAPVFVIGHNNWEQSKEYTAKQAAPLKVPMRKRAPTDQSPDSTSTSGSSSTYNYGPTSSAAEGRRRLSPAAIALAAAQAAERGEDPQAAVAAAEAAASTSSLDEGEDYEQGDWWEATVLVPPTAAALKFVVQYGGQWDNNGGKDYTIAVEYPAGFASYDVWADSLLDRYIASERKMRLDAEEAEVQRRKAREEKMARIQEHALAVRKRQMRHVLYTEPEVPQPGKELTVYYNPSNTALNGCMDVYLRGGFNRWKHAEAVGPVKMAPPKIGDHFQTRIEVPEDAAMIDMVFANVPEGDGVYDNRGGLDYHIPVENPKVKLDPLHVVHIAVEMAPICKVGGLGDVVTSLARAVKDMGNLVEIVLPRYRFFQQSPLLGATQLECEFDWGGTRIYVSTCVVEGLRCFFVEPRNGMFDGDYVYGGRGDDVRFDFFCRAAMEFLLQTGRQPDVLHCHDWSSATVAKAYWDEYRHYGLYKSSVVFTIHNLNYGEAKLGEAAYYCQRFTTVSPTYAYEIGGNAIIAPHVGKFMGIRNGIDMDLWDPESDQFIPMHYDSLLCEAGKKAARDELRARLNMTGWEDKPIVSVVSRLTKQKGIHLIKHAAWRAVDRGAQFVLLGSAPDPRVQAEFDALNAQMSSDVCRFCFMFDEPLSHLIYAASDIVLVPSMFEPCGLTQLIAMRYGAVPVVRSTGGLRDTVFDVDYDKARSAWEMEGSTDWQADAIDATNGFAFEGTDEGSLDYGLNRALDAYYNDKAWFRTLQKRVMEQDWSWSKPAIDYVELYYRAIKDVSG